MRELLSPSGEAHQILRYESISSSFLARLGEREQSNKTLGTTVVPSHVSSDQGHGVALLFLAVAPAPRCADDKNVAGQDTDAPTMPHLDQIAVGPHKKVFAALPGLTTLQAKRRHLATVGKHRYCEWFVKSNVALDTVATFELAVTPRPCSDAKRLDSQRKPKFKNLWVGKSSVCHVGVNGITPVKSGSSSGTATNRLVVVDPCFVPKGKVVHCALRARKLTKRAEQAIRDRLRHLNVAGHYRGGVLRINHGSFWIDDLQWFEAPSIQRDTIVHQCPENVDDCGGCDGLRGIEIGGLLWCRPRKVDGSRAVIMIHRHLDLNERSPILIRVHAVRELAVTERANNSTDGFFCIILHMFHVLLHYPEAVR
mmetsp:Transcript_10788/g.27767  ORF Transcript_10788/g.27767 Transcript_10788/m.27767 type:complete len:368 (-) Transcript_10788:2630-3733(-)